MTTLPTAAQVDPPACDLRRRAVLICIVTTLVVTVLEVGIGWFFNLISITAEGLHTGADLLDSLVAFILIKVASRPADGDHPFGHGKYDSLAAIIEGSAVGITAIWATFKSCMVLLGLAPADPHPELVTIIAMASASVLYFFVSGYVIRLAKKTQSPAVFAEAMHLRTHIYITAGLLVGLLLTRWGLYQGWSFANRLDALVALALGLYLLSVAYRIIRPGFRQLMDTALSADELREVAACLDEFRGEFVEIHAIRSRQAGTDKHIDIHLVVDAEMTVKAAHDLAHRLESRLMEMQPGARLLVHIEPAVGKVLREYQQRGKVGAVVLTSHSPVAREADHHADRRAHEL